MTSISEVPRTLNQSAYSFHLDLLFIPCLPIRTEVARDYSLIPSKRRKFISFWLIDCPGLPFSAGWKLSRRLV
jgi:hypothetical protein